MTPLKRMLFDGWIEVTLITSTTIHTMITPILIVTTTTTTATTTATATPIIILTHTATITAITTAIITAMPNMLMQLEIKP